MRPRRDDHSSGTPVAGRLKQPTRATGPRNRPRERLSAPRVAPIRFCSRRGLPCRRRCRRRGALLPHPFTLTRRFEPAGGLLSVALSLGLPPPDVIRRRVPLEPGLSSILDKNRGRPADWPGWIRRASGAGQGDSRDLVLASPQIFAWISQIVPRNSLADLCLFKDF